MMLPLSVVNKKKLRQTIYLPPPSQKKTQTSILLSKIHHLLQKCSSISSILYQCEIFISLLNHHLLRKRHTPVNTLAFLKYKHYGSHLTHVMGLIKKAVEPLIPQKDVLYKLWEILTVHDRNFRPKEYSIFLTITHLSIIPMIPNKETRTHSSS